MTETTERKAGKEYVEVICQGIVCEIGFALTPTGYDQSFASFQPGIPLKMEKHYADFLIAQDPYKFQIVEKKLSEELPPAAAPALAKVKRTYNRKQK